MNAMCSSSHQDSAVHTEQLLFDDPLRSYYKSLPWGTNRHSSCNAYCVTEAISRRVIYSTYGYLGSSRRKAGTIPVSYGAEIAVGGAYSARQRVEIVRTVGGKTRHSPTEALTGGHHYGDAAFVTVADEGWHGDGRQNSHDGYDDHQLDECKTCLTFPHLSALHEYSYISWAHRLGLYREESFLLSN